MDWHEKSGKISKPRKPKKPMAGTKAQTGSQVRKTVFFFSWSWRGLSIRSQLTKKSYMFCHTKLFLVLIYRCTFFLFFGGGGGETLMITLRQPKIRGKADPSEEELHPRSRWRLGSSSLAKSRKDVQWSCNSYSFPNLKTCICILYIYIYIHT